MIIAALIGAGSWRLLRSSAQLAVDGVPDGIDEKAVVAYLEKLPGVTDVHHMHIWPLSTTKVALTVHLVRPGGTIDDTFTQSVAEGLSNRFGIAHATIQLEHGEGVACPLKPADVV